MTTTDADPPLMAFNLTGHVLVGMSLKGMIYHDAASPVANKFAAPPCLGLAPGVEFPHPSPHPAFVSVLLCLHLLMLLLLFYTVSCSLSRRIALGHGRLRRQSHRAG